MEHTIKVIHMLIDTGLTLKTSPRVLLKRLNPA
jgi:hypothetical protein